MMCYESAHNLLDYIIKLILLIGIADVGSPGVSYSELMEPQHIHYTTTAGIKQFMDEEKDSVKYSNHDTQCYAVQSKILSKQGFTLTRKYKFEMLLTRLLQQGD